MTTTNDLGIVTEARRLATAATTGQFRLPGNLTAQGILDAADEAQKHLDHVAALRRDLTAAVTKKDAMVHDVRNLTVRLRTAVKAEYGDNSVEYEAVGGKRSSERKRPTRSKSGTEA
jgi:hypothetical protein